MSESARDGPALRETLGRFATGVTIVTVREADGAPVGMTMSSFNAVSLDPPLVLFSIARQAGSLASYRQADSFIVNVLDEAQGPLAARFGRSDWDKWRGVAHRPGRRGAPILAGALAHFECARHAIHDGGDHEIFVVEVIDHAIGDGQPLLFYGGRLRGLGQEYPESPDWHIAHYY